MKKYIRTPNGIYETWKAIRWGYNFVFDTKIKEADTIEELCDGFYLDLGGEFNDIYLRRKDRFEFLKELAFDYMRKGIKVTLYAFIKTSKGLIYVAKMNEKGELELI